MGKYWFASIYILSVSFCYCAYHYQDPRQEFTYHEAIEPKVQFRGKRQMRDLKAIREWRSEPDLRSVVFSAFGRDFSIDVTRNELLLSPRYAEIYQEDGRHLIENPMNETKSHCNYKGQIKGEKYSWAALSACDGLNGVVYDGKEFFHLYSYQNSSGSQNLIFKASDLKERKISCGVNDLKDRKIRSINDQVTEHRFRHSPEWHFPHHDNSTKFVELMVVADNTMFLKYGRKSAVFQRVREIVNIMHAMYIPMNVFIVLVGVLVWNERNFISVSRSSDETLNQFASYRSLHLRNYAHDNAQLITNVNFGSEVVGLAFTGSMCTKGHSVGINQDYSSVAGMVASVMAHEMGHNFNMKHDKDSCYCQDKKCIMANSTSGMTFSWSSCSKSVLMKFLEDTKGSCLTNLPNHVALPECGNGVIELNEQCDCGISQVCDNPCCNSTTCRFYANATCASGDCCDMTTCKIKKVSTMCRRNQSECDLPEFCDGKSPFCPIDVFIQDGTECKDGMAFCFQGNCQTHDDQCHLLWGNQSKSSPSCCYHFNTKGDEGGNCGYNLAQKEHYKCHGNDSLCGTLQCSSTNSAARLDLKVGTSLGTLLKYRSCSFMRGYPRPPLCHIASIDFGLRTPDLGVVAPGTKCDKDKMCFRQKCIGVEYLKKPKCPQNCYENGICNSKSHCHCIMGFGPPVCDLPGVGGSMDSGPPSDPEAGANFVTALYVMFFCIYPCLLIIVSVVYLYCYDDHMDISTESRASEPPTLQKLRSSLRKLPRPSLRSVTEDVPYESFSSEEEEEEELNMTKNSNMQDISQNYSHRFSPKLQIPLSPVPKVQSFETNRLKSSHEHLNPDSKQKRKLPLLPPKKAERQQSLGAGVILQVQSPRATEVRKLGSPRQLQNTVRPNLSTTANSDLNSGVANLTKRFERL